jgi:hypothetical protein
MPRQEGLRPIGESVKKIIEKIKKEREERQKKSSSPRTQPKLPGMKIGGSIEKVPGGYAKEGSGRISDKGLKGQSPQKVFADKEKRMENVKSFGMKKKMMKGGEAKRPRREKEKQGIPPKPTTKPSKPMMPPMKKKDSGYDKTKNQPRQDAGVEYDKGGPSRPGKNITGYALKEGGLTGGQKKLDANKDGTISGEDFKILRGKNNKMKGGGIAIKGTNFKGVF